MVRRPILVAVLLALVATACVSPLRQGTFAAAGAPSLPTTRMPYWRGWDIARSVTLLPSSNGGYVLDGYGGVHAFGLHGRAVASPLRGAPYWRGRDLARGMAVLPDGSGGFVLDDWGGLHPFALPGHHAPARPTSGASYWPGWSVARGVAILPDGTGGYILDAWGGLHPFGLRGHPAPPKAVGGPYWRGWDIARGVVLRADGHGGYVLDGFGGLHPFALPGHGTPARPAGGSYWRGWDIARSVALFHDGSGYVLDGFGGLHPFAKPGAVTTPRTPPTTRPTTTTTRPSTPTTRPSGGGSSVCATSGTPPARYAHVIWIWMENKSYRDVIGNGSAPYETNLARACGSATDWGDAGRQFPSEPSYIGATSGLAGSVLNPFAGDAAPSATVSTTSDNLFRQVRAAGGSERSYEEGMTANCANTGTRYAPKHNPALYYWTAGDRAACATDDVPMGSATAGAFVNALNTDTLPTFSFVTPNLCNDTHDCAVSTGDAFLSQLVPRIVASPAYRSGNTALFVVWDEDTPIPNIVVAPSVRAGTVVTTPVSHYSLLRATEEMLGLPLLGAAAAAPSLRGLFNV